MEFVPFFFERRDNTYLLSNILRDFIILSKKEFDLFVKKEVKPNSGLYDRLIEKHFIYESDKLDEYAKIYLETKEHLFHSTFLHIFVVSLECNLNCLYCQADSKKFKNVNTNMTEEIASKAIDIALQCPQDRLEIEFQGGEPLMNFSIIKYIIEQFNIRKKDKIVKFSIVTNAGLITKEIIDYLIDQHVSLCFSLDGSKIIHDYNRPSKNKESNYDKVDYWTNYCFERGVKVGLLPTVTSKTLQYPEEFLDALADKNCRRFSIRELAPLGRCLENWEIVGYTPEQFFEFYKRVINLIYEKKKRNISIIESYTLMYLKLIYTKESINFTDFKSPCGAGIGQMAYNWNGNIYACDEGRIISNDGDETFKIGDVNCTYSDCMKSEKLEEISCASCIESHPICKDCVFSPICGLCPAYNYSLTKTLLALNVKTSRCKTFKMIADYIIDNVENKTDIGMMFLEWLKYDFS